MGKNATTTCLKRGLRDGSGILTRGTTCFDYRRSVIVNIGESRVGISMARVDDRGGLRTLKGKQVNLRRRPNELPRRNALAITCLSVRCEVFVSNLHNLQGCVRIFQQPEVFPDLCALLSRVSWDQFSPTHLMWPASNARTAASKARNGNKMGTPPR